MRLSVLCALLCFPQAAFASWIGQPAVDKDGDIGLLLLARPGSMQWESACRYATDALEADGPVRTVLQPDDFRAVQKAIVELEAQSRKILVVPLGVSSSAEDFRCFAYYVGISSVAGCAIGNNAGIRAPRMAIDVPLVLVPGMEDDAEAPGRVEKLLKPHVRPQSQFSLVLLGREAPGLNAAALTPFLEKTAAEVKRRLGLYGAEVFVINDQPAPRMDKMMSVETTGLAGKRVDYGPLRAKIRALAPRSRVLVAGYAPEGDDMGRVVERELFGSFYVWVGAVSLSDADLARYARKMRAEWGAYPSMRRYFAEPPAVK